MFLIHFKLCTSTAVTVQFDDTEERLYVRLERVILLAWADACSPTSVRLDQCYVLVTR
jgi:hypothetical protein